jgi:hypothetical protein
VNCSLRTDMFICCVHAHVMLHVSVFISEGEKKGKPLGRDTPPLARSRALFGSVRKCKVELRYLIIRKRIVKHMKYHSCGQYIGLPWTMLSASWIIPFLFFLHPH